MIHVYTKQGMQHRVGGPAYDDGKGNTEWWKDGKRHRADGPAVEDKNGTKEWWVNDKLHRVDGPAIEYANGHKEWWAYNTQYSYDEWLEIIPDNISYAWKQFCLSMSLK